MREIKFRGKDIDQNKWRYGGYAKSVERGDNGGVEHMYRETEVVLHYVCEEDGQFWIVHEETIGQSIGKIDANYILIFDGDRLKRDGMWPMRVLGIRVVPDDDVQRVNCIPSRCKGIDEFDFSEWEVFGNIHDKEAVK